MQKYELTYLISPALNENELEQAEAGIEKTINQQGKIISQEKPEKISLSYPVKKQKEAFFVFKEVETEPEDIQGLKQTMEKEKDILRFIIVKKETEKETRRIEKSAKSDPAKTAAKEEAASIDEELDKILNE